MLLCYLDESYTKNRYYIAALVVPQESVSPLAGALDEVVRQAHRNYHVPRDGELHGHEVFHGEKIWRGVHPRQRIGVYNDAFQAIADHPDVGILLRGVDSKRLRERYTSPYPPHQVVLMHTLEQIDATAKAAGDLALIIADEVDGQSDHRRQLWEWQHYATEGYLARQIAYVIDTMHFVPSCDNRLVQAADLIAFLHRRRKTHIETDARAKRANDALWARIEPQVRHEWCWHP